MKKFILNADDLAKSEFHNNAVLEGFKKGYLKSASVMVNMPYYEDSLNRIIKIYPDNRFGVHLNLMEGKALNPDLNQICDKDGYFNNSYLKLILKSNSKKFLNEIEKEFRSQIEKALNDFKPSHLDSHVHTHGIPEIFNLCIKLAVEYKIPYIRTQAEIPYFINDKRYNLKTRLINFIKVLLLNYFTLKNKAQIKKYPLKTNDYMLGIGYSSMMDSTAILEGLKKIKKDCLIEALIHPCKYNDDFKDSHTTEFEITQDDMLFDLIKTLGYEII